MFYRKFIPHKTSPEGTTATLSQRKVIAHTISTEATTATGLPSIDNDAHDSKKLLLKTQVNEDFAQ